MINKEVEQDTNNFDFNIELETEADIDYTFQDEFEELAMKKLEILEKLNAANANGGARHKLNNELRAVNEKLNEF